MAFLVFNEGRIVFQHFGNFSPSFLCLAMRCLTRFHLIYSSQNWNIITTSELLSIWVLWRSWWRKKSSIGCSNASCLALFQWIYCWRAHIQRQKHLIYQTGEPQRSSYKLPRKYLIPKVSDWMKAQSDSVNIWTDSAAQSVQLQQACDWGI